jgi:lipopolysaccharide export system permease protein
MRFIPGIVDRYVGRQVTVWIIYVSLFLCLISWLIKFMEQLRYVGTGTYTVMTAVESVTMLIPHNFYVFFPLSALMGTVVALCLMSARSELVVLQACGVSKLKIVTASVKMAIPLMLFVILIGEFVVPYTQFKYDELRAMAIKGVSISSGVTGNLWVREKNDFFYMSQASAVGELKNVEKYTFDPDSRKMISHSKAEYAKFEDGKWKFFNITTRKFGDEGFTSEKEEFAEWSLTLTPDKFNVFSNSPDELSIHGLYSYIKYLKKNKLKADRYELEFWRKTLSPFAVITMIFLASTVAFGSMRSLSLSSRIVLGIVYGFVFYVANQTFSPMSLVFGIQPFICVLLPSLVFFFVAVFMLRKR